MTTTPTNQIVFLTVPNLVTCGAVTIEWTYNSTTPPTSNYPLVVTNVGVNQGGLNRRKYSLVPRQSTTVVNTTLAMVNVSTGRFDWAKVNIPQGWYRMDIYATAEGIPSNIFNVTNGLDVSCVVVPSIPSSFVSSVTPTSSYSRSHTTSSTNIPSGTSTPVVGNSSARKRAVVGGIVGGVAVLALIAAIALWMYRRKTRAQTATPRSAVPAIKGRGPKGHHNPSDSTGAILPCGSGNQRDSPQISTSEDDFASEKSALADDDTTPKLPSAAATKSFPTSSKRPSSMVVKPSFESCETPQSRPSTSPPQSRHPSDRTRRTSRKPVPVYNPGEFPGSEPNDIPLSDRPEVILGGGKKIYYLIPDTPLEQRK